VPDPFGAGLFDPGPLDAAARRIADRAVESTDAGGLVRPALSWPCPKGSE
jgi:hypothetical protein